MSREATESKFLRHENCDDCGSSDARGVYEDGSSYCFSCSKYHSPKENGGETVKAPKKSVGSLSQYDELTVMPLEARGITQETCEKFGVRIGKVNGKTVQAFPFYKDNQLIAFKTKDRDKNFSIVGNGSKLPFFGQHLWKLRGKKLVVTEGEIDCMTISQLQGNQWPVVSVPTGAQSALKTFRQNIEWLDGWDEIVIMFDMDEPGREAAKKCAEILRPGQAKIASYPLKDANEMLLAGRSKELMQSMWDAKEYRPDGIIAAKELWSKVAEEDVIATVMYPYEELNKKTKGLRRGELVTVTSGSGMGKSAFVRELAMHLIQEKQTVGLLFLEENPRRTMLGLMGIYLNTPLHISREGVNMVEMKEAYDYLVKDDRLFLYDHFGSTDVENLLNKIRYMARGMGCQWIILDHLSIIVSGIADGDERRLIDNTMTQLRTLVEETGIGLILVSHLKRAGGDTSHEEGGQTSLSQLRGSHAIAQLSDLVIGLERNQQSQTQSNVTTIRVLKNRFSGATGTAGKLIFDPTTGRLSENSGFKEEEVDTSNAEF
jgi:twinkle protein